MAGELVLPCEKPRNRTNICFLLPPSSCVLVHSLLTTVLSLSPAERQKVSGAGMGNNVAGLTYYASNEDDPYITLKDVVSYTRMA